MQDLKIYHDLQLIHQALAGPFRLIKGLASNYLARALVCNTEHKLSSTAIRQGTAATGSLIGIKVSLGLFELILLAFLGLQ